MRQVLARAAILALALGAFATARPAAAVGCEVPTAVELDVVRLVNVERTSRGLAPVALDARLVAAAVRHSDDMLAGCFLSHTGSDGSTPSSRMRDAGYPGGGAETAGAGQATAERIVQAWLGSSGHRAILLDARNTHVGVGHAEGTTTCLLAPYGVQVHPGFWTADFGRSSEPPLDPSACGGLPACRDGVDNDGDGRVDYLEEFDCTGPDDPSEAPACSDGVDNDGDGQVDHPADPECATALQMSEARTHCGLGFEVAPALALLGRWRRRRVRARRSTA